MKIVVDAFGGDNAPVEIVEGCVLALKKHKDLKIVLCGSISKIREILDGREDRIEIVNANEVISNDESPTEAIRKKTDSSLVKAFDTLKNDESVCALISAGSTGAILTGAIMKIGRMLLIWLISLAVMLRHSRLLVELILQKVSICQRMAAN